MPRQWYKDPYLQQKRPSLSHSKQLRLLMLDHCRLAAVVLMVYDDVGVGVGVAHVDAHPRTKEGGDEAIHFLRVEADPQPPLWE